MRRYDDPVDVRRGMGEPGVEGPEQFLWRGRLWKVRAVLAHWVETGPWWQSPGVRAVIGSDERAVSQPRRPGTPRATCGRAGAVARRGRPRPGRPRRGVFDLSFDWSDGRWQLVGCAD